MDLNELARSLNVLEKVDVSAFQRRARVLQSIWREEQGFVCGEHRSNSGSRLLGSRLSMPWAQETLSNFITTNIREVVRCEVCNPVRSMGKLYGKPRIFNDLLSSQPLCFNLFGELSVDLPLASSIVRELTEGRFPQVHSISFEHSPGRRDPRYTGDRSAFDVFIECSAASGGRGFIGIEVKYHENLIGPSGGHQTRYDEIAHRMACFAPEAIDALMSEPLQQIWRDHLLAGITREVDNYDDAMFVMLYPTENEHVRNAVTAYRRCLTDTSSFSDWTLEDVTCRIRAHSAPVWNDRFIDRHLSFEKIETRLGG
jgi:hypothetical protein